MKELLHATMVWVLALGHLLAGISSLSPAPAFAAAPPPPTETTPPLPAPQQQATAPAFPAPGAQDLSPGVEQARARHAIQGVLDKHLQYWGPRYQIASLEVNVQGRWAYGLAHWHSQARTFQESIHILARRSDDGLWQALMPSTTDGLYLQWLDALPQSLLPPDQREPFRAQAVQAETLMRPPQLQSLPVPSTTPLPPAEAGTDIPAEPVLKATRTPPLSNAPAASTDALLAIQGRGLYMRNPAAVYCVELGYQYTVATSPEGDQYGLCRLPDRTTCDAWDFFTGRCGQAHSLCAREGLQVATAHDGNNPFSADYAVCVNSKGQRIESVTDMMRLLDPAGVGAYPNGNRVDNLIGPPSPPPDFKPLAIDAPAAFDWRTHNGSNWMTAIKDQGQCGSCWAFASIAVAEAVTNIGFNNPNLDLDLAEQYLVTDCALDAGSCAGGNNGGALAYIRDYGVPDEGCLPYGDGDWANGCGLTAIGACDASKCTYSTGNECSDYRCTDRCGDWQSRLHFIDSTTYFGYDPAPDLIKDTLVAHGPLAVAMYMGGTFDQNGVYHCSNNTNINHGVTLVGYDDAGGYWIVKNSWGQSWGPENNGYFKVAYDDCTIQKYPHYADVGGLTVGPVEYANYAVDDDTSGESDGNDDGAVNCGEDIELYVDLLNQGSSTATGVNATISTADTYVTWLYNTDSAYPDLVSGGVGTNSNDFDFRVASDTPDGHIIQFTLDVTASNGGPWSDTFNVPVACTGNNPPHIPASPSPADGATGQSIYVDLGWTGGDPDSGDTVTYDVYFEANDSTPDNLLCNDVATTACDPGTLAYATHYYWYVVASDNHGASRTGPTWDFTTGSALVPGPLVYDGHTANDDTSGQSVGNNDGVVNCGETIELYVDLYNQGNDVAADINATLSTSDLYVTFIYNTSSVYPNIAAGASGTNSDDFDFEVDPDTPDGHVISFDLDASASNGGPWSDSFDVTVTCTNHPPHPPANPAPPDGATGQGVNVNLGWAGHDPDGDSMTYDVYFEANDSTPDNLICNDVAGTSCDPGTLTSSTPYYWYVVATDAQGAITVGDVWSFTTESSSVVGPLAYHDYTVDDDTSGNSDGNGDGIVNCQETIELFVALYNQGSDTATGITATLSTSDPYVNLLYNSDSSYPDIPGGGVGSNQNDFDFTVDANVPPGHAIPFELTIYAATGGPWTDAFDVPVMCNLPDLMPSQWGDWQYPVVPASITGTNVVNSLYAGYPTYLDWGLSNMSNVNTGGNTYGALYIDDVRVGYYDFGDVSAWQTWAFFDWLETIDTPGWHTLKSVVDPDNLIYESDETNNIFERDFYWIPVAPYADDMENGTNDWTATGLWHQVSGASPYPDSHSGSHSWWYGQDTTGDYDTGAANSGTLTSPPVYIPNVGYYLRFWYRYETETQGQYWDQRRVQISVDDGPFQDILQLYDDPKNWWLQSPAIDLSTYAGHTIRVRFYFDTLDDLANGYRGWYIDDWEISDTPPPACNDPYEPNDLPAAATPLLYGQSLDADLCPGGDYDFYSFTGTAGDPVVIDIDAIDVVETDSLLDPYIFLLDSDGTSVLAQNDDEIVGQVLDSRLGYQLTHDGTFYVKVKAWDHPAAGSPDHFYTIRVLTDTLAPASTVITSPLNDDWLDPTTVTVTVSAVDNESGVNRVEFLWHNADWENSDWQWLGADNDSRDGWDWSFDTTSLAEQQGAAFYVWAFDWVGNWTGAASWNLGLDRTPPTTTVSIRPMYGDAPFCDFWVNWWANYDDFSGIVDYDVQYRDGSAGAWTDLITHTMQSYTRFAGQDDHTYYFRARARDFAGNQGTYATGDGDAQHSVDVCDIAPDAYEADDVAGNAPWITTDGISQTRNIHVEGNPDWGRFYAADGVTYTLATSNTGGHADTVLSLYDTDSTTLIGSNDDYPGLGIASRLDWQPETAGVYYVRVDHWDPWAYGCTTQYVLSIVTSDEISPTGGILINNDDERSPSPVVSLTLSTADVGTGVGQMKLANDPGFSSAPWMPYDATPSWTLASGEGMRTAYVKFRDRAGNVSDVYSDTIFVYQPVSADFTASPKRGPAPLTVYFTDLSSGPVATRVWDFGDGGTSLQQHPTYTYTAPGRYTVGLTVRLEESRVDWPGGTDTLAREAYVTVIQQYDVYLPLLLR